VETVRTLDVSLIESVLDQALGLYGAITVSLTGGEPLLHPRFPKIAALLAERRMPYRFVTNGWHLQRVLHVLEQCPPESVMLSLSGATEQIHDAERGRGSFCRVLMSVALLTSRHIPAALSMVIDRRNRHQLADALDLAETLGCRELHYIPAQPVAATAARDSDLPPHAWDAIHREIITLARRPGRRTRVVLSQGAPARGQEQPCDTKQLRRLFVDARGQLVTCCQLSGYGHNSAEVVADLTVTRLASAVQLYRRRLAELIGNTQPQPRDTDPFNRFPCIRCARSYGKLEWLRQYPKSPWHGAAGPTQWQPPASPSPGYAAGLS
jgi:MoaA/NifB/PqqE/SkfB family radical SAM enzyme